MKWMLVGGAVLGALAVASGAFGAHALDGMLDARALGWYDTAVTYHAGHALALVACGLLAAHVDNVRAGHAVHAATQAGSGTGLRRGPDGALGNQPDSGPTIEAFRPTRRALTVAGVAFLLGIALFSGSLYLMAFTGLTRLGMITPLGGVSLIIGWIAFAVAAARLPSPSTTRHVSR